MNWFTNGVTNKVRESDDVCEHVEKDSSLAWAFTQENDSFGVIDRYVMCKECSDAHDKASDEELVCCHDCNEEKATKYTRQWKWYDFHAPEGYDPLVICDDCWEKDKHVLRMRKDNEDYEWEFGEDPNPDYE